MRVIDCVPLAVCPYGRRAGYHREKDVGNVALVKLSEDVVHSHSASEAFPFFPFFLIELYTLMCFLLHFDRVVFVSFT